MGSLVFFAALLGLASAAPNYYFLPSGIPYGYGGGGVIPYSAPIHIQAPQVVHPVQRIADTPAVVPQKPLLKLVDVQEATQFHSQDGRGQFLFGYSIPDQARIESRTSDGTVRGSYSYLDPVGRAITVQYVADESGYHAASNELPVSAPGANVYPNTQNYNVQQYAASSPNLVPASVVGKLPTPVEDTPEVAAAREAHLRAHQAALEAHAAAVAEADAKEAAENDGGKTPIKEGNSVTNFEEDVGEQEEVEEEGSDYDKTMDESDEGVVIESDVADNNAGGGASSYDDDHELTYEKDRYPKLQYTALPEQYDPAKVHDEENNAVIVTNPEFANSDSVSTRIGGEEKTEGNEGSNAGKGAFFYSFRHAVPVYVAVPQGGEEGYQQQHPYGEPQLARQQPFPPNRFVRLLTAPGVLRVGPGLQQPQTPQTLSISERASLLGAVPLAAVHDAQVSPSQRGSIKDHQTLPLYIPPAEIEEN